MRKFLFLFVAVLAINHYQVDAQTPFTSGILFDNPVYNDVITPRLIRLADGGLVTAGKPATIPNQFYITKYNSAGTPQWQKLMDIDPQVSTGTYQNCCLAPMDDSGFVFLTYKLLYPSYHTRFILARFDGGGNMTSSSSFYYAGNIYGAQLLVRSASEIVICAKARQDILQQDLYNSGVVVWTFDGTCSFTGQSYMRPAYPYPVEVSSGSPWYFSLNEDGGIEVAGHFTAFSGGDPVVLKFSLDTSNNPGSGMYFTRPGFTFTTQTMISDRSGVWLIGETDTIASPPYVQQNLAVLHLNNQMQADVYKHFSNADTFAQYQQVFATRDSSTGKFYIGRSTHSYSWNNIQPLQFIELDSTGELITAGSMYAAEFAGIVMDNHMPVSLCRGGENSWGTYTILTRHDTTSLVPCYDLGNPVWPAFSSLPPSGTSVTISVLPDSIVHPANEVVTVQAAALPQNSDYCLTTGEEEVSGESAPQVQLIYQNDLLQLHYSSDLNTALFTLYDAGGTLIMQQYLSTDGSVNTQSLASGIYFVSLDWGGGRSWQSKLAVVR